MAHKSEKSADGTSFHNTRLFTSVNELIKLFGSPDDSNNSGEDKVNFEWVCETEKGDVFTIYDWKEYRVLSKDELIQWHIGGKNENITEQALHEIKSVY